MQTDSQDLRTSCNKSCWCEAGCLYLRHGSEVIAIRQWPDVAAWVWHDAAQPWQPTRPTALRLIDPRCYDSKGSWAERYEVARRIHELRLWLSPFYRRESNQTWVEESAFWNAFPHGVKRIVTRFPERHYQLLEFCAMAPEARDLIGRNPFLAFCLANAEEIRLNTYPPWQEIALCGLTLRQRDALALVGFPGTEAVAKITRRIKPENVSVVTARGLRFAASDPVTLELLAHAPRLTCEVLELACDPWVRKHVTPGFLAEVAGEPNKRLAPIFEETRPLLNQSPAYVLLCRSVLRMTADLWPGRLPAVMFHSIKQLYKLNLELFLQTLKRNTLVRTLSFPPPPFRAELRGGFHIQPITAPEALLRHAYRQRNCVARYAQSVAEGKYYVYEVTSPVERCTLGLSKAPAARWQLGQFLATCNRSPSASAVAAVTQWLEDQQPRRVRPGALRIVHLEDAPAILEVFAEAAAVRFSEHEWISLENSVQALELIRHTRVDLLIQDIVRPGLNGWQTARIIREELGLRDLPILILSGQTNLDAHPMRGLVDGAMRKPCEWEEFFETVERLLARRRPAGPRQLPLPGIQCGQELAV